MSEETILEVAGVTQRFGRFVALNNVSARFQARKLSAIIGPNGAGKSTFFNVVSGAFPPSAGTLKFQGRDITGLPQHEFARIGIAKSFQITNVFKRLSAHENVRVAVQMRHARWQLLAPRAGLREVADRADELLARVGLAGGLRALHLSVVPIDSLHYLLSGQAVMMCLLGGMGTFFGPFVGAGVFLTLEDVVTTFTSHWMAVVGTVFMVFVLFFPAGIWGSLVKRALRP